MQATRFPKILAFVEGTMERMFINHNFRYVEVVPLGNGSGWSVAAICKKIGSTFVVKNMDPDKIIVWLDLEKQQCSASEFRDSIKTELVRRGADSEKISICIPNRMTENIILADEDAMRKEFHADYEYSYEGQNGKRILADLCEQNGRTYKETFDGVALLKKIRLGRAAQRSPSAQEFLATFNHPCWWIGFDAADSGSEAMACGGASSPAR
jgi:hypothetical protein